MYKELLYNVGMTFKTRLSEARKQAGLTQAELGEAVGSSSQAVSQWERGKTAPELEKVPKIARRLQVSETWLLADDVSTLSEALGMVRVVGYVGAGAEA